MANQSHAANMTQGSIWKLMVRFAIPIFLGNLFQQFYNVADTFIVGNVLGTEAMAAVGSSGNLIFMLIGFFQGVFVGAGVVVSRFWGARDHDGAYVCCVCNRRGSRADTRWGSADTDNSGLDAHAGGRAAEFD